ncbi:MAG: 3-dehydroquinate synthase II [Bacillota bacterium]|nr:3-dehydroquinate synthase II [Bacillota bacterium]
MNNKKELWFDARNLNEEEVTVLVPLATNNGYSGVMVTLECKKIIDILPESVKVLIFLSTGEVEECKKLLSKIGKRDVIIFSKEKEILKAMGNIKKGLYLSVDDKESLDKTVEMTQYFKHVVIEFKSETNIPLELVLAFSQKNNCSICKKVTDGNDGWIASMVMEMGSHSVLLSSKNPEHVLSLKKQMDKLTQNKINIKELTIVELKHIGMGDRICIDTTSTLKEDEGLILGSTSSGGILVSSETHFLPYMELRPFRVNAGALHLYAWNAEDKTDYLSELKAGSEIMTVDSKGNTRFVSVGRIKMERRPLLLVKAKDENNIEVNVIIQDDWHVRIIGVKGNPMNCTELKPGDKVLGYTCESGRHVGIKIDENIIEK